MKKVYCFILMLSSFTNIFSQENQTEYHRNTISPVYISNNTSYNSLINQNFSKILVPSKYFYNPIPDFEIAPKSLNTSEIINQISNKQIAAKSLHTWKSKDEFISRAKYNLSDNEIDLLKNTQRGVESKIADEIWFKKLIKSTYIIVIDFNEIITMEEFYNKDDAKNALIGSTPMRRDKNGYQATVTAYLYQINLDDKNYSYFTDNWTKELDNPNFVDSYNYDLNYIGKYSTKSEGTQLNSSSNQKSNDALFVDLLSNSLEQLLIAIGDKYEPFTVKNSIYSKNPITSNIGKKESLKPNQLCFVYENRNEKWEKTCVLRAKKVADNRVYSDGNSTLSSFYKVNWGNCDEGMLIKPHTDKGVSISIGYLQQPASGLSAKISYSVYKLLKTSDLVHLKLFIEGNYFNNMEDKSPVFNEYTANGKTFVDANKLNSYNLGIGFEYEIFILPGIQLVPFFGYYIETTSYSDKNKIDEMLNPEILPAADWYKMLPIVKVFFKDEVADAKYGQIMYFQAGIKLPINLTYNLKLVPSYSFSNRNFSNTKGIGSYSNFTQYPKNIVVSGNNFLNISLQFEF